MQSAFTNRIAELVGDEQADAAAPAERSAAQRAASRKNGAKSRGPKTLAGKARSRANAMKHGLLARVIAPPADARGHDRLFRQFRRGLVEELRPEGFVDRLAIDGLAADLVQLARVRQMIEELQRPPAATRSPAAGMTDAERWQEVTEARRILKLLDRLRPADADRDPFPYTPAEAARVAARLATYVGGVREDWAQYQADLADDEEVGAEGAGDPLAADDAAPPDGGPTIVPTAGDLAFEAEEDRLLTERAALVGDAGSRLCDRAYVSAVLCGRGRAKRGDRRRIRLLLGHAAGAAREWLNGQRDFVARTKAANARFVLDLAAAPERLMVLDRYQRSIERAVERKLRQLRQQ